MTLHPLRDALSSAAIERDDEIRAILLGLIAREHVLLVGPPGTAKSYLCRLVSQGIDGLRFCERLLSPTTPPEVLFGPLDLDALRDGRYEHKGEGSATECEILFLDEVFRASDAIRDSLLHLLGPERQALIGTRQVRAPLRSCIGASNSWAESADQQAFLDRWLIRRTVRPLSPSGRERLLFENLPAMLPMLRLDELDSMSAASAALPISDGAREALRSILESLASEGIRPSDRRCKASVKVARASATLDGATEVEPRHLEPLVDVLWDQPQEQPDKCAEIVLRIANPTAAELQSLLLDVEGILASAGTETDTRMAAIKKLEECERRAKKLLASGNGRAKKAHVHVKRERLKLHAAITGMDPERLLAAMDGEA